MANETPLSHLPFELLPSILTHLRYDFASLARLSLVNKSFCLHAQPLLWTWLRLREVRLVSKVRCDSRWERWSSDRQGDLHPRRLDQAMRLPT